MCDLIFKRFEFDAEFGFVIPSPLLRLDDYFDPWINLVTELELLRKTPDQLKKRLRCRIFSCLGIFPWPRADRELPLLDSSRLCSVSSLRLAHTVLSILSHSWVHLEPGRPAPILPRPLALPWASVSARLGLPPVVVHSTMSLSNWRRISAGGDLSLDNVTTIFSFDGSRDLQVRIICKCSIYFEPSRFSLWFQCWLS